MTDVFHKNGIVVSGKLAKIMGQFVDMGQIVKPRGHILARKNRTGISRAMERSQFQSQILTKIVTAP